MRAAEYGRVFGVKTAGQISLEQLGITKLLPLQLLFMSVERPQIMIQTGNMKESAWAGGFDKEFFSMVRDHSMQAYYGSPRHGGNKNNMSYKMLKLDYPLIIGQNRYKT